MKHWLLAACLVTTSMVAGLDGAESAQAGTLPCIGYGSCSGVDMSPPEPLVDKSPTKQRSGTSMPKRRMEHVANKRRIEKPIRRTARIDDWYLHRPSTPREQAETRALNLQASRADSSVDRSVDGSDDYVRMQRQYQLELRDYRAALEVFEARARSSMRYLDQRHIIEPPYVPAVTPTQPPTDNGRCPARSDDAARLAPWHGYSPAPGNGY
jgi:hypothetical protein